MDITLKTKLNVYHAINMDHVYLAIIKLVYHADRLSNIINRKQHAFVLLINKKKMVNANKVVDLALLLLLV